MRASDKLSSRIAPVPTLDTQLSLRPINSANSSWDQPRRRRATASRCPTNRSAPSIPTTLRDHDYQALRAGMRVLLDDLGIATVPAAA